MQLWQIILFVFLVALPLGLMVDFWGDQRYSHDGRPGTRAWRPIPRRLPDPDAHH